MGSCHCFGQKYEISLISLFLANVGQQKLFNNVVDRKLVFLDCKNIDLKKSQIGIFPKGLVHGFGQN